MKQLALTILFTIGLAQAARAEEDAAPASKLVRPVAAPIARVDAPADTESTDAVKFVATAKWEIAGYNNEELIYTIVVANQDKRIIRCTTQIKGSYFEGGEKFTVEDRQVTTIFPDREEQVGNWMGMDQKSGATYSVKCRPV